MAEKEKDNTPEKREPTMKSLLKGYKTTRQLREEEAKGASSAKKVQPAKQS